MPKPTNVSERNRVRRAAKRAQRRQVLLDRGYTPADADALLNRLDSAQMMITMTKLARKLGVSSGITADALGQAESSALDDLKDAVEIVGKYDTRKAEVAKAAIAKVQSKMKPR